MGNTGAKGAGGSAEQVRSGTADARQIRQNSSSTSINPIHRDGLDDRAHDDPQGRAPANCTTGADLIHLAKCTEAGETGCTDRHRTNAARLPRTPIRLSSRETERWKGPALGGTGSLSTSPYSGIQGIRKRGEAGVAPFLSRFLGVERPTPPFLNGNVRCSGGF